MKRSRKEDEQVEYEELEEKVPKSFVFHMGKVAGSVKALEEDLRLMMEPNTAAKLKEMSSNTMKDFLSVSGMLGVTHFMVLSQTDRTLSLRVARVPHGPTVQFKVERFATMADVRAMQVKKFGSNREEFIKAPLLVLNNLGSSEPHVKAVASTLQNLFPALRVGQVKLKDCNRVVLVWRDAQDGEKIRIRHYKVVVNPHGISKSVKRVAQSRTAPSLGSYSDVADYVLSAARASESDAEDEEEARVQLEGEAHLKRAMLPQGSHAQGAVRLVELGPRLDMRLAKIQTGLLQGEVLWHWKGVDHARLKEQRAQHAAGASRHQKQSKSEFPGFYEVQAFEQSLAEKERQEQEEAKRLEEEKEAERKQKKEERRERQEAKKQENIEKRREQHKK